MMKETMLRKSTATISWGALCAPRFSRVILWPIDPSLTEAGSSLPNLTGHDRRDVFTGGTKVCAIHAQRDFEG
jgi:hypothetical protein